MKTRTKRYHLAFDEQTDTLIRQIVKHTDWKICVVIRKAIELLAKERKITDE